MPETRQGRLEDRLCYRYPQARGWQRALHRQNSERIANRRARMVPPWSAPHMRRSMESNGEPAVIDDVISSPVLPKQPGRLVRTIDLEPYRIFIET